MPHRLLRLATALPTLLRRPSRFSVDGTSMEPTLHAGDSVLVDERAYEDRYPQPGEIVLVRHPVRNDFLRIKRVIAGPGERVQLHEGVLLVDGQRVFEPYTVGSTPDEVDCYLGRDEYFVLGDNRAASTDSRSFGPVPLDRICGRVAYRYLPGEGRGPVPHHQRVLVPDGPGPWDGMDVYRRQQRIGAGLMAWGLGSVIAGLGLQRQPGRPVLLRALGGQFAAWGAVDAVIGLAALLDGRRKESDLRRGVLKAHAPEKDRRRMERLLWINAGLDVLYIAGGGRRAAQRPVTPERVGSGLGIVVQGGFLFVFDVANAWAMRAGAAPKSRGD